MYLFHIKTPSLHYFLPNIYRCWRNIVHSVCFALRIAGFHMTSLNFKLQKYQPRSQALSPLPPFVVGRKTLVAAGHVTTQNLGGKKIYWVGGVPEYFDCCCGKLCGFQNLEQSLKKLPALSGSKSDFADEEGYIISAVSKI